MLDLIFFVLSWVVWEQVTWNSGPYFFSWKKDLRAVVYLEFPRIKAWDKDLDTLDHLKNWIPMRVAPRAEK